MFSPFMKYLVIFPATLFPFCESRSPMILCVFCRFGGNMGWEGWYKYDELLQLHHWSFVTFSFTNSASKFMNWIVSPWFFCELALRKGLDWVFMIVHRLGTLLGSTDWFSEGTIFSEGTKNQVTSFWTQTQISFLVREQAKAPLPSPTQMY